MIFSNITNVNAASASISVTASSTSVVVGSTFTITYKISSSSALGSWEFTPSYDTSKFKLTKEGRDGLSTSSADPNTGASSGLYSIVSVLTAEKVASSAGG